MDLENLSLADAKSIQTDAQNEHHRAYVSNDKKVVEAVSKAYERNVAGNQNLSNLAVDDEPAAAPQDQLREGGATLLQDDTPAEDLAVKNEVQNYFQEKYGGNAEQRLQYANAALDDFVAKGEVTTAELRKFETLFDLGRNRDLQIQIAERLAAIGEKLTKGGGQ